MICCICYVCAVFRNKAGEEVFRVTRDMLGTMIHMPEAVREDMLFNMLVNDGSLKIPESTGEKKRLENDPMTGITAEGKDKAAVGREAGEENVAEETKSGKKTTEKK